RWTSGVDPVKEVRGSQWRKGIARVVVEMTRNHVGYLIDETPDGLVVAIESKPETAKASSGAADTPKVAPKPAAVVAAKVGEKGPRVTPLSACPTLDGAQG